jgi:hypothetical protein
MNSPHAQRRSGTDGNWPEIAEFQDMNSNPLGTIRCTKKKSFKIHVLYRQIAIFTLGEQGTDKLRRPSALGPIRLSWKGLAQWLQSGPGDRGASSCRHDRPVSIFSVPGNSYSNFPTS